MRVILDNCVDRRFAATITGHEVEHASARGWEELTNGKLLDAAEAAGFDLLLSVDKNLRFQQNFANRRIALVVLDAKRIDLASLQSFESDVERILQAGVLPGEVVIIPPNVDRP
jgi:hypothetical protein